MEWLEIDGEWMGILERLRERSEDRREAIAFQDEQLDGLSPGIEC